MSRITVSRTLPESMVENTEGVRTDSEFNFQSQPIICMAQNVSHHPTALKLELRHGGRAQSVNGSNAQADEALLRKN